MQTNPSTGIRKRLLLIISLLISNFLCELAMIKSSELVTAFD
jgi:hypothetical protein